MDDLTSLLFGHLIMKGSVAKIADDLFVGGNTVEELYSNVDEVLQILAENNLKLKAKKTVFTLVWYVRNPGRFLVGPGPAVI